jgi:SAM-dependent methyltransferase
MSTLPAEVTAFVAASPIQRGPIARAVAAAATALPRGARVLDAGAGAAPYRPLFAHCEYLTQDWPGTVHQAARAADVVADLHELPVADRSFDFVLCTEVLEHVADPRRVLAELHRVLRPGGGLLVSVPFVGELHEEPHDHWRFTSHGLDGLLSSAGFTDAELLPLTCYWSTLAHVMRHGGLATRPVEGRVPTVTRVLAFGLLCLSAVLQRLAPALDGFDARRALPVGWTARAVRPTEASSP